MSEVVPYWCEVCKAFGRDHKLFRVSAKGEDGAWRCEEHLTAEQKKKIEENENENGQ